MFKFIIILNFILLFSYNSLSQSFNKTIAMHGSTNRDTEARDTKVNINAPINKILKLAKIGTFNNLNPYIIKGIAPPGIKGLVTANGNYITKQSAGIYSTEPIEKSFSPKDPCIYQAEINSKKGPTVTEFANGKAIIETYTIMYDRSGPSYGILFGRLDDNSRFIANTIDDKELMLQMTRDDYLGLSGRVKNIDGINIFTPD